MKIFILMVMSSLPYGGNTVVVFQEFSSQETCKVAADLINNKGEKVKAFCIEK